MATSTDYSQRTVDAWAFSGAYTGELAPDLLGNDVCAGIVKLAQRWMVGLLTETGSVPYRTDYGTTFITRLRQGELRAESDIAAAFLVSSQELADRLADEEEDADPPDERYDRCELLGVTISEDWKIDLRVRIYSQAGDSRVVLIPVKGSVP